MTIPDNSTIGETDLQEIVDIPMFGKKNVILDATILNTLMACARLADFRFNLNLQSIHGRSNSLECGSIVHKFLEVFYNCIIQGLKREQAIGFAMAAAELYIRGCPTCTDFTPSDDNNKPICGHKKDEYPGVRNTPRDPDPSNPLEKSKTGWRYVLETCEQYLHFYRNDHWVPLEIEVVKGEVFYEDDEIRIMWKSKLDYIGDTNQGIYPMDHKTMKQRRDTNSNSNQFIGQCMIMKTRQMFINRIGFQTSLKPEEKFTRAPVSYTPARMIEWQSEILPYYAKLLLMYAETGHWPANWTHCEGKYGNCAFYENVCSQNPDMRQENIRLNFIVGPEWNPTNDED